MHIHVHAIMVRGVRAALEHQKDGSIRYDHMRRHHFVLRGITKLRCTPGRIMQREFTLSTPERLRVSSEAWEDPEAPSVQSKARHRMLYYRK